MVNEEIATVLKNAVEHGGNLQEAMEIMVNSGYNFQEVQEASRFIGGITNNYQAKPDEQLTMPSKKLSFPKTKQQKTKPKLNQETQAIKKAVSRDFTNKNLSKEQTSFQQMPLEYRQIPQTQSQQGMTFNIPRTQESNQVQPPQLQPPQPMQFQSQQTPKIPLQISHSQTSPHLSDELKKIKPPKKSHLKEIILLIILLILVGILIATFLYKDTILGWFS